jgi:hypothetical protein
MDDPLGDYKPWKEEYYRVVVLIPILMDDPLGDERHKIAHVF